MNDTVRCPSCRGAKKIAKLGGIVGECNTCMGKGTILLKDKPVVLKVQALGANAGIIGQVARCLPIEPMGRGSVVLDSKVDNVVKNEKVDGKRAVYKRKKA